MNKFILTSALSLFAIFLVTNGASAQNDTRVELNTPVAPDKDTAKEIEWAKRTPEEKDKSNFKKLKKWADSIISDNNNKPKAKDLIESINKTITETESFCSGVKWGDKGEECYKRLDKAIEAVDGYDKELKKILPDNKDLLNKAFMDKSEVLLELEAEERTKREEMAKDKSNEGKKIMLERTKADWDKSEVEFGKATEICNAIPKGGETTEACTNAIQKALESLYAYQKTIEKLNQEADKNFGEFADLVNTPDKPQKAPEEKK